MATREKCHWSHGCSFQAEQRRETPMASSGMNLCRKRAPCLSGCRVPHIYACIFPAMLKAAEHGALFHPHHCWYMNAAHTPEDIAHTLQATDAAFEKVGLPTCRATERAPQLPLGRGRGAICERACVWGGALVALGDRRTVRKITPNESQREQCAQFGKHGTLYMY